MVSFGALARSKSLTFLLFFILLFAIVYQVHRNKLINEKYATFLGFGKVDPWLIHGSVEEKGRPKEARYEARVEHIKEKCKNYPSDGLFEAWNENRETYTDIVVDETRRLLFCGVPKAATKTWKRLMLKATFDRYKNVPIDEIRDGKNGELSTTHGQDLKYLTEYSPEQRKEMIRDYYKFLVVRPPFERLLSAYRDKTDRLSFTFFNKKVMESLKERDLADEYIYFDVESFHQFVEFILARTPQPLENAGDIALEANQMLRNEMRVFDVCRPCSIQYDFVGKFETLQYDMEYVLKKLNINLEWPDKQPTTTADYIRLYYHGLKKTHLQELFKQYRIDFDLFEYSLPAALYDVSSSQP